MFQLLFAILLTLSSLSAINRVAHGLENISDFQWQKRLIIVFSTEEHLKGKLEDAVDGIDERHVLWFLVSGESLFTNYKGAMGEHFLDKLRQNYSKDDGLST